jgi:hypothetical protein
MRKLVSLLVIALLIAMAAACTTSGASTSPNASGGDFSPSARANGHHTVTADPKTPILKITNSGGLAPPGYQLTEVPIFALYGDGCVIVRGAVDAMYPGPLLPNLRELRVTPDDIQKILAAAETAGLLGPDASYEQPGIADAETVVFRTTAGGATHVVDAYALSEAVGGPAGPDEAARTKLRDFEAHILNLAGLLGRAINDASYQPTSMRVFAQSASATTQSGLTPQEPAWPLTQDPAIAGQPSIVPGVRCIAIDGEDLASFMEAAKTARSNTVWTAHSGRYSVTVRPLYPDESGCPSMAD